MATMHKAMIAHSRNSQLSFDPISDDPLPHKMGACLKRPHTSRPRFWVLSRDFLSILLWLWPRRERRAPTYLYRKAWSNRETKSNQGQESCRWMYQGWRGHLFSLATIRPKEKIPAQRWHVLCVFGSLFEDIASLCLSLSSELTYYLDWTSLVAFRRTWLYSHIFHCCNFIAHTLHYVGMQPSRINIDTLHHQPSCQRSLRLRAWDENLCPLLLRLIL
jgi:hypothetical protein